MNYMLVIYNNMWTNYDMTAFSGEIPLTCQADLGSFYDHNL